MPERFFFGFCDNADPAAVLDFLPVRLSLNTFDDASPLPEKVARFKPEGPSASAERMVLRQSPPASVGAGVAARNLRRPETREGRLLVHAPSEAFELPPLLARDR